MVPSHGWFYLTKEKVGIISRSPRDAGCAQGCDHLESQYLITIRELGHSTKRESQDQYETGKQ